MNPPDKCPRCDASRVPCLRAWQIAFHCGSMIHADLPRQPFDQSTACVEKQRDALAARVKELEAVCNDPEALWHNWLRGTVALPAGIGDVRKERERVKELEAYAERLIGAGDRSANLLSCSMGLDETDEWANTHGAHKTRIASDAIADWEKAKETKP